jgi:hypothetical protein
VSSGLVGFHGLALQCPLHFQSLGFLDSSAFSHFSALASAGLPSKWGRSGANRAAARAIGLGLDGKQARDKHEHHKHSQAQANHHEQKHKGSKGSATASVKKAATSKASETTNT